MNHRKVIRLILAKMGSDRLSQREVAERADINRNLLNFYLNEHCLLFEEDLRKVLRALDIEGVYDRERENGVLLSTAGSVN